LIVLRPYELTRDLPERDAIAGVRNEIEGYLLAGMPVSRAIVKFVPGGQTFMGEEPHPLDPRQEPLHGRGPVSAAVVIVERLDDQPHTLGFAQYQPLIGLEYAICVHGLSALGHSIEPSVTRSARADRRIKFRVTAGLAVSRRAGRFRPGNVARR
jgi:hypothetical protein